LSRKRHVDRGGAKRRSMNDALALSAPSDC
jgi:hypothetical protein